MNSFLKRRSCLGLIFTTAVMMTVGMLGCGQSERHPITKITVVGSSTIAPLMSEIAKAYEKANPGVRIEVQAGGTSRGLLEVRQGSALIGMVSRELQDDEKKDFHRVLLGKDGLAMIVHKSNPVKSFTKNQVIDIYSGVITNWKELGGLNQDITVVSKAEGRSTLEIFSNFFGLSYKDIKADVIIGDNQQGIQTVAGAPASVGYVSIGTAEYEIEHGAAIRLVPLDDNTPSTAAVSSGRYPLIRELNLIFKADKESQLGDLLAFAQSAQADDIVSKQFFVPAH